jgi:hypothetical protein
MPAIPDSKTNERRASEVVALETELHAAVARAKTKPNDPAAWVEVATLAGNIQRRSRLLAGLGRGG